MFCFLWISLLDTLVSYHGQINAGRLCILTRCRISHTCGYLVAYALPDSLCYGTSSSWWERQARLATHSTAKQARNETKTHHPTLPQSLLQANGRVPLDLLRQAFARTGRGCTWPHRGQAEPTTSAENGGESTMTGAILCVVKRLVPVPPLDDS